MSEISKQNTSRREFLKKSGKIAAGAAIAAGIVPKIYAAGSDTIGIALIGCGGRGTGAASEAMSVKKGGPIRLIAMADVFERKLERSYRNLQRRHANQMDVPKERRFLDFDGYKKAMDCLNAGDIAIFATPPAFRWVHFAYAVKKRLNVFMEKPVTVDGPTTRRMLKLAEESERENLKVGVGLMIRHCRGPQELKRRIDDGEIGNIIAMHAYRMAYHLRSDGRCP